MSKKSVPQEIKVDLPADAPKATERTLQEIQNDFTQVCAQAGHCQYQVYTFNKDLEILNQRLRALNLEAAAAQVREAKANE